MGHYENSPRFPNSEPALINVTKTHMPNKDKYKAYVDEIYENGWVTNYGPLVKRLETRLADYLGVKNVVLVSNGTAALEIAYRTLDIDGFAITTPFSFVATTSSLVTNNIFPIFADIDSETFNVDAYNIESLITPNTKAIVPVHVFGNPCDVEIIDAIAKKNKLKLVYDASHAFGVKYKNRSILQYGDISTLSFHATKLFHTIEGGALIINDDSLVEKARFLINFGIEGPESIPHLGINAKMNEFEAAMGLCMLDEIESVLQRREHLSNVYKEALDGYVGFQKINENASKNFAYLPVFFRSSVERLNVQQTLNVLGIYPRRYFFPSLDTLSYIEPKQFCRNSRDLSDRILALPLYDGLEEAVQLTIIDTIRNYC